jgi:hypothetical protein
MKSLYRVSIGLEESFLKRDQWTKPLNIHAWILIGWRNPNGRNGGLT